MAKRECTTGNASQACLFREEAGRVTFPVQVVPRASRSGVAGILEDAVKLRIAAPPVEGKANAACTALIAEVLGVRKHQVEILAGLGSRRKTVAVAGRTAREVWTAFSAASR